jgi:hypothetical protein
MKPTKPATLSPETASPRERLATLRLTPEELTETVMAGEFHRRRCTRNHPPSYGGYGAWAEAVARLGDIKRVQKWTRRDPSGLSLVVNPDGTMAVTVQTGDHRTGRAGTPEPQTKYGKGITIQGAVDENVAQLELLDVGRKKKGEGKVPGLTWVLLVHRDRNEIRSELSLPQKMDEDNGRIYSWRERIILEPIVFNEPEPREPLEPTEAVDISVEPIEE